MVALYPAPGTRLSLSQGEREVAKRAFEGFADNRKVSHPSPSSKMAWHNFTITVFRFTPVTSLLSLSLYFLPLLSWSCKVLTVLC